MAGSIWIASSAAGAVPAVEVHPRPAAVRDRDKVGMIADAVPGIEDVPARATAASSGKPRNSRRAPRRSASRCRPMRR